MFHAVANSSAQYVQFAYARETRNYTSVTLIKTFTNWRCTLWLLVLDALFLLTFISFGPRACGIPLKIKRCDSEHVTKLVFAFVFLRIG